MSLLLAAKGGKAVNIPERQVSVFGPAPQTGFVDFGSDGRVLFSGLAPALWYAQQLTAIGNEYELRATIIEGVFTGQAPDVWVSLSSGRLFEITKEDSGIVTGTIFFEIRLAGSEYVIDGGTISFDVGVS